jgi:AraC family transcriptional regulator, transcriptional activator of pobA
MTDPQELKTYFHFEKDTNLEIELVVLPSTLLNSNKPHLITPHRTNFYHVFLFEDCHPTHWVDFQPVEVQPYSLLFVGKGQVHQFDDLMKYKGYELIFTEEFYSITDSDIKFIRNLLLFNDFLNRYMLQFDKSTFQEFYNLAESIQSEIDQPVITNKHQILKNLVHNFLLLAQRKQELPQQLHSSSLSRDISLVLLFKNLLEQQFKENKSVVAYAGQMSITEKKLGNATKQVMGKLPKDLIDERILLEAKRFLTHSQLTVKEIGFELGFDEPTYFTKFFKKYTDQTPVMFKSELMSRKAG